MTMDSTKSAIGSSEGGHFLCDDWFDPLYVKCREDMDREASPTACVIDSQSVKSAEKRGAASIPATMIRANKVKGKTRHIPPCDDKAVLVIDETGFLKQGKASCVVARQYTGSAGKITNCQIGVFAACVSDKGHAFIDHALYLLKAWTSDFARMRATHVPETVGFATKPALAVEMIERALAAHVPFAWVAANSVYGVGDIEAVLRRAGKGYVLGVNANHWLGSWCAKPLIAGKAKHIAAGLPKTAWKRLSAGPGTKGERLYDWAYCELADLDALR